MNHAQLAILEDLVDDTVTACAEARHRCRGWCYVVSTGWAVYERVTCRCTCHRSAA